MLFIVALLRGKLPVMLRSKRVGHNILFGLTLKYYSGIYMRFLYPLDYYYYEGFMERLCTTQLVNCVERLANDFVKLVLLNISGKLNTR